VDPNRPKTAPVSGVVTYKGQPVEGATITFFAQPGKGRGAVGSTDASGQFTMTTFQPKDGAIPGSYRVSISKMDMEGAPAEGGPPTGGKKGEGGEPFSGIAKDLLPTKYKDAGKSGLTAEVKEDGAKDLKFELTD
jgi:hypothetical protein